MKLSEIVPQGAIVPQLASTERDDVVRELLDAVVKAKVVPADLTKELVDAVLERERRGSTGFGKGVAVPHVKHPRIKRMAAAIGISEAGVDFNALDKQPVYSIFLLLSPSEKPEEHLQAMEVIFKNLSRDTFRRFLRLSQTVEEVRTLLEDSDGQKNVG